MNYKLRTELLGKLFIMRSKDIKPNFSALSRQYGFDRATIRKYYNNGGITVKKTRNKDKQIR